MTTAKIGYLAQFWIDDDASLMTKIAEVIELGLPNPQQDDVEATHFESPGRAREYIAGLINNGEITVGINYVGGSASDLLLTEAMASGETRSCEIWIPTTVDFWKFSFTGIVKGYEKTIPIDDRQTATITIRVSGAVTEEQDS